MTRTLTALFLLFVYANALADIIKYDYSLSYTGYEYYGVNYISGTDIGTELNALTANPFAVSFTYDDSRPYYSYWLDGDNGIGEFGSGDDILVSRFGPSRGDNYYDLTSFDITPLFSLLDALIVEFPVIERVDTSNDNEAYVNTRTGQALFFITKDFYRFTIEDNALKEEGQIVFYLNELSQLAINFESQLVSRTVTATDNDVAVPAPQTSVIFALGAILLLLRRRSI
ncbi:hypothetical protein [Alteromonas sp. S005]|uniref:hypothetical protein n=1 Tax=Alteromonas sp. S005 TaxID=3117400 RepID=UPI002FE2A409